VAFSTSIVTEAFITPKVARWARERVGISQTQLAEALGADAQEVEAWEQGETHPPFGKAQDLAKTLRVPFGFLFLSEPPPEKTPIPDLRTVVEGRTIKISPDFLELLNDVLVKHEWYREYLEERQAEKLPFVGKFRVTDGIERVSADLSRFLAVEQSRKVSYTWDEFLRQLSRTAEAQGILVMRSGIVRGNTRRKLSVSEFRGFVISDDLAPLVFINGRDSKAAQIFTLVHELVHIWIDESGISNPDPKQVPDEQKNKIERFCNSVTAEVLVPHDDFLKSAPATFDDQTIQNLAARYRVSTIVILRRAYELGAITKSNFFTLLEREQQKQKQREEKEAEEPTPGGNFYVTLPVRNSRRFTETVLSALQAERVSYREAATLLGVKTGTIPKLIEGLPRR
jgi:Zn-dependent peptidase ImmA (M78 family)/DNA-binding XRE family transcriptional regulator